MSLPDPRRRLFHRAAWLCAVLVLAVTSLSAFLRQSGAGLGCEPWPACHARAAAAGAADRPATPAEALARGVHRVSASALLLLLLGMGALTLRQPRMTIENHQILMALGLVLFLAVLGPLSRGSRLPAVALGHLLAGLGLFALCVRMALGRASAPGGAAALNRWVWVAGVLLMCQIALGGLVSAGFAGLSCPQLAGCSPGAGGWAALDPWQSPGAGAGLPGYAAGVGVQFLHRAATLVLLLALIGLAHAAWANGARAGALLPLGLVVLQAALGLVLATTSLPLATALAHNALAGLLLASVWVLPTRMLFK